MRKIVFVSAVCALSACQALAQEKIAPRTVAVR